MFTSVDEVECVFLACYMGSALVRFFDGDWKSLPYCPRIQEIGKVPYGEWEVHRRLACFHDALASQFRIVS